MNYDQIKDTLKILIEEKKQIAFTPEYRDEAKDEETLGMMVAQHFEWDGIKIMEAFARALEDANFHTECDVVNRMIGMVESGARVDPESLQAKIKAKSINAVRIEHGIEQIQEAA